MNDKRPSFTQVGVGALLIAFIAALLGLRPGGEAGKSAEKPAAEKALSPEAFGTGSGGEPHRQFLLDYLYPPPVPTPAPGREKEGADGTKTYLRPGAGKPYHASIGPKQTFQSDQADRIVCLVVSVADPVDTPFGFWFDQVVESMTRAAGAFNYSPAGHWFPWEAYQRGVDRTEGKSGDGGRPPFELYPGVMLFRHRDPTRTLVVLLVGETVNGIRGEALKRALNLVHEIDRGRTKSDYRVRLVAPFFSGAQAGLFRALGEWSEGITNGLVVRYSTAVSLLGSAEGQGPLLATGAMNGADPYAFDVISGSANGIELPTPTADRGRLSPLARLWRHHRGRFRSTIIPSKVQQNVVLGFLKQNPTRRYSDKPEGMDLSDVAILVESNTGFGGHHYHKPDSVSPLYLPFPMRLARVQGKYARQRAEREKRIAGGDVWLPGEGERRQPRLNPDMAPTLDEATTPRLDDRGVEDITATIRRKRIRYVGLSATDPQDVVFLVERIKRDCPNVQVFVTGMDLVYALPENRHAMRGVVIGSTYPLYPPNQEWTNPDGRVRQTFMSESGQGCYNAAVFHLTEALSSASRQAGWGPLQEYSPPVFAEADEIDARKPPVWVFTMGENGRYVPNNFYFYDSKVTFRGEAPRELMAAPRTSHRGPQGRWPALGAYAVPLTLLVLGAAGVLLRVAPGRWVKEAPAFPAVSDLLRRDGWRQVLRWWHAPMGDAERRAAVWQNLALPVVTAGLAAALSTALVLLGSSFHKRPGGAAALLFLACAAAAVMLFAGALLQLRLLERLATTHANVSSDRGRAGSRLAWNGLLSLAGWAFAVWVLATWWFSDRSAGVLFVERATLVQTGYSVLPPLFLLAAGLVAIAHFGLRRQHLHQHFRIDCPYPNQMDEGVDPAAAQTCGSLHQASAELQEELASFTAFCRRRPVWLLVAGVGTALAAWPFWYHRRGTYEGRAWDALFLIAFLALTWGVVFYMTRFLACWKGLETLLERMALLPMVRAFDRLPRKAADLFGGYFRTHRPRASHLAIPLSILRQLRHEAARARNAQTPPTGLAEVDPAGPALARMPGFDHCPAHIADNLDRATAWPDPREMEAEGEYPGKSLNTLSHDAQELVRDLARYWPHHSIPNAYGDEPPDSGGKTAPEDSPGAGEKRTPGRRAGEEMPSWVQKAEDFVAVQAIVFLSQFFIQLHALGACAVWGSVLLLLAATAYPFQPEQLIMYLVFTLLLAVAGSIVWVLVWVNKNEIVSRITRSTPNRFQLNWTFAAGMLQYVGPIVLVLLVSTSGRLRTLIEPLLNLIR